MRNPVLHGDRVYLRAVEAGDGEAYALMDANETDTFMWRRRMPDSPIAGEAWIKKLYEEQPPKRVSFSVCLKADDRLIGRVSLIGIDWLNRTAETASIMAPGEFRGHGYGTEAKHLLLEYAFDRLGLHVLMSFVHEPNTRSAAALDKQGYRPAGRARWVDVKDGRYIDGLLFDVTREEWLAARRAWRPSGEPVHSASGSG
jgi:RimJ/RimL family protein N-acetyltransferase